LNEAISIKLNSYKLKRLSYLAGILTKTIKGTYQVISVRLFHLHIFKTVFANKQLRLLSSLVRIRTKVPRVDLVLTELYLVNVFYLGELFLKILIKKKLTTLKSVGLGLPLRALFLKLPALDPAHLLRSLHKINQLNQNHKILSLNA